MAYAYNVMGTIYRSTWSEVQTRVCTHHVVVMDPMLTHTGMNIIKYMSRQTHTDTCTNQTHVTTATTPCMIIPVLQPPAEYMNIHHRVLI